jgi:hypothetical protein
LETTDVTFQPLFDFLYIALVTGDFEQRPNYPVFLSMNEPALTTQNLVCNLESGSFVTVHEGMTGSDNVQRKGCFAEEVGLCVYLIDQIIYRDLAENSGGSAVVTDDEVMDLGDLLGSEANHHDAN